MGTRARVIVALIVLAACGGGLTHAEYIKKVNAVCDRFNAQQKALTEPTDIQGVPGYVDQIIPAFTAEIAAIGAFKPPKQDKAKVDEMLADVRAAIPQLQKLKTAVVNRDQASFTAAGQELDSLNTKVNDTATSIGLTSCAKA